MQVVVALVVATLYGVTATPDAPATDPRVSTRELTARSSARVEAPAGLFDVKTAVEQCFGVVFSNEPLPEQCAGAEDGEPLVEPFAINVGDQFGDVIERLEEVSQGRWLFEEIHGVPLLRPNNALAGHGTLLDTIVTVDIKASSMWDALCALARAVNEANGVHVRGGRPLIFMFFAPSLLRHPPQMFIENRPIAVSVKHAPAREGLCAIIARMGDDMRVRYSYTCFAVNKGLGHDVTTVLAFDSEENKFADGGKMTSEDLKRLEKTVDWMSGDAILAVQAPKPGAPAAPQRKK